MKKINLLFAILLVAPLGTFLLFSQNSAKKSNLIYLHEQTRATNSCQEHLNSFSGTGKVVLDFYADWCGPCKRMSPLIDQAAATMPNMTFIKINRDHFLDLSQMFNIHSIPTLVFLDNGKEISRYDGKPLTQQTLTQLITTVYSNR